MNTFAALTQNLGLGGFLANLDALCGRHRMLAHWQQGEFHHDLLIELPTAPGDIPGRLLVVATNCNGGVKEVLCFDEQPEYGALWHHRCPENPEFAGTLPPVLAATRTVHWFDPCALLADDARRELKPDARERQPGGGWRAKTCGAQRDERLTDAGAGERTRIGLTTAGRSLHC